MKLRCLRFGSHPVEVGLFTARERSQEVEEGLFTARVVYDVDEDTRMQGVTV
jgi:hypothetical protein